MSTPYVVKGATLACSLGSSPSALHVDEIGQAKISGMPMATVEDFTSSNIKPFGTCNVSVPPPPCVPNCREWLGGKATVLSVGVPCLLETCVTLCFTNGGMVSITDNGQGPGMASTPELRASRTAQG